MYLKIETKNSLSKKTKRKESKGITLIALVITIIVLLILAGVSIAMLTGDNGLLSNASKTSTQNAYRGAEERVKLATMAVKTEIMSQKVADGTYNATSAENTAKLAEIVRKDFNGDSKWAVDGTTAGVIKITYTDTSIDKDSISTGVPKEEGKVEYVIELSNQNAELQVDVGSDYTPSTPQTPQTPSLPSTAGTTPYLPSSSFHQLAGTNLTDGLVITDATGAENGNEYVWIEVPNDGTGPDYTQVASATVDTDGYYTAIATALRTYCTKDANGGDLIAIGTGSDSNKTTTYGFTDEWYSGCGITDSASYTTLYRKMLKSVYTNGGFWIGRYEAGTGTARQQGDSASGIIPLSKIDQYPINWVTCSEAQTIASSVPNKGEYTSSLMFGIQWDLVLRHLSNKGVETNLITGNSETWGNYKLEYSLNQTTAHGYKGILSTTDYSTLTWSEIESEYTHNGTDYIALSTGATERNMKKNIYDLAGNMFEWTLEKTSYSGYPCVIRGGSFNVSGSNNPVSYRNYSSTSYADCIGRVTRSTLLK